MDTNHSLEGNFILATLAVNVAHAWALFGTWYLYLPHQIPEDFPHKCGDTNPGFLFSLSN